MLLMSPVLEGSKMVLDSLARLEKAETYCSATVKDAAAFPFCTDTVMKGQEDALIMFVSGVVIYQFIHKIDSVVMYKCDTCSS